MIEIRGDMWDYLGQCPIVVTTGGLVLKNGCCVMPRGCARQAKERFPDLAQDLGQRICGQGNHVQLFVYEQGELIAFPVEASPFDVPEFSLIRRSALELRELTDRHGWHQVVLPRPGCGGGGLLWNEVRPCLEPCLDDRFLVITH
ncbi:MAG: ADP-ribose-binding protein [Desulfuromonadaceae bacterium]|nr:ADP-ribose-binding protein [Desulfuromonadaceae bacterium]